MPSKIGGGVVGLWKYVTEAVVQNDQQSRQLQIWQLKLLQKQMARQAPVTTQYIVSFEDCGMYWLEIKAA